MFLDGSRADIEFVGDLDVGGTLEEEGEDFALAFGQCGGDCGQPGAESLIGAGNVGGEDFEKGAGAVRERVAEAQRPRTECHLGRLGFGICWGREQLAPGISNLADETSREVEEFFLRGGAVDFQRHGVHAGPVFVGEPCHREGGFTVSVLGTRRGCFNGGKYPF